MDDTKIKCEPLKVQTFSIDYRWLWLINVIIFSFLRVYAMP